MSCDELGKQTFTEIDKFTIDGDGVITFVQGTATSLKPGTKVGSVKGPRWSRSIRSARARSTTSRCGSTVRS